MELPIITIYNYLNESFPDVEWFTNEIPESFQKTVNLPLGRISEIQSDYEAHSSNIPNSLVTMVQVDVWVKDLEAVSNIYYELDKKFTDEGIVLNYSNHTYDPDFEGVRRIIKRYVISQQLLF